MLVIEGKTAEKITVSFSSSVGKQGLRSIKKYIEFLEEINEPKRKIVPQSKINKVADEITAAAWKKMKKERAL
jgi:hypothetical protein